MSSVLLVLIGLGAVLVLGALGEVLFQRTGVPDVLFLIIAGLVLGPALGLVQRQELLAVTPYVASVAIVLVTWETSVKLRLAGAGRPSKQSLVLATVAFLASAGLALPALMIAASAGLLAPPFGISHAWLVAAALGTAAAPVSIPALGKARVDPDAQRVLEDETAASSVLAIVTVAVAAEVMTTEVEQPVAVLLSLLQSLPLGVAIGLLAGLGWTLFLRVVRSSEHAFGLTFGAALIVFATSRLAHASALLAVLAFSLTASHGDLIANLLRLEPSPVQGTDGAGRHGLVAIVRGALFVVAGMWLAPPWAMLLLGLAIAILLAGGRLPAALAAGRFGGAGARHRWLLAAAMPRGVLAIALSQVPFAIAAPEAEGAASVGASVVLLTALLFVSEVLVLQRFRPGALFPETAIQELAPSPVSVIDSSARQAIEVEPSITAAPAGPAEQWGGNAGPPTIRTPLPLPAPRPPPPKPAPNPRQARSTLISQPDAEDAGADNGPATPRVAAPPIRGRGTPGND